MQHATGPTPASVFQPVAFFHNQPAFMLSTQSIGGGGAPSAPSIQELQMMGAINPVRHQRIRLHTQFLSIIELFWYL